MTNDYYFSFSSCNRGIYQISIEQEYILFDDIYTKENFQKNNDKDWDKLLEKYQADFIVYIGNDYDEDIINNDKVISILSGHFLTELKNIGILNERGK